jgi:hypothetical protein
VLSPALAFQRIADHLAGTSVDRFVAFERHAADVERSWHDFFAPRILQLRDMTRADMDAIPAPAPFSGMPAAAALSWPCAGLSIWTMLALVSLVHAKQALGS